MKESILIKKRCITITGTVGLTHHIMMGRTQLLKIGQGLNFYFFEKWSISGSKKHKNQRFAAL